MTRARSGLLLVLVLVLVLPGTARAAPAEFTAVRVDRGLVYIDIGSRNGVAPGQALELVAREGNNEPFHLGWIVLESCGETVSLARVPAELEPYIKVGTILRLPDGGHVTQSIRSQSPPSATPTTSANPPAAMPSAAEVAVDVEAKRVSAPPTHAGPDGFRHEAPMLVPPGVPLTLSVYAPSPFSKPMLMYRVAGGHTYTAMPFTAQPDSYYVVTIPSDEVQAPAVEYYVTIDGPNEPRLLAFATPEEPRRVAVEGRFNETSELARYGARDEVSATSELVTYHLGNGTSDYYYRAEGDYLHRIFKSVYSMRFGAGYLAGVASEGVNPRSNVGFLYAYSESEFRSSTYPITFIPRIIFGVNQGGVGGGFEARFRLGDELGMNFEGGVTILSALGFETFTTLTLHPTVKTSIALAAYLENLPLADSLGFRSYVDVRHRVQRALWLTLRVGVAARSIDTIGPDTGVGVAWGF